MTGRAAEGEIGDDQVEVPVRQGDRLEAGVEDLAEPFHVRVQLFKRPAVRRSFSISMRLLLSLRPTGSKLKKRPLPAAGSSMAIGAGFPGPGAGSPTRGLALIGRAV